MPAKPDSAAPAGTAPAMPDSATRHDVALIVAGEDWSRAEVCRVLTPDRIVVLRGAFGEGFDLSGPHAGMCSECGVPVFAQAGHGVVRALQRHYGLEHGVDAPLLLR